MQSFTRLYATALIALITLFANLSAADEGVHKVAIQVSSGDAGTQTLALNNVANLISYYGMDNVEIELVAYGPGLSILTAANPNKDRVSSMALQNVTFSACGNTMANITKKTGKEPVLTDGVQIVEAGVVRLMDLQSEGYSYIRP